MTARGMLELIVEESPIRVDERWDIIVRLGTDIKIGDRFRGVTPYSVMFSSDCKIIAKYFGHAFLVDLVVSRIETYGHEFDMLNAGMAAKVSFIGDASAIPPRAILSGSTERE